MSDLGEDSILLIVAVATLTNWEVVKKTRGGTSVLPLDHSNYLDLDMLMLLTADIMKKKSKPKRNPRRNSRRNKGKKPK